MRCRSAAAAVLLLAAACREAPAGTITVRAAEIEFPAAVQAAAFDGAGETAGYHAVVARGGHASHAALLVADVTDRDVLDALEQLGAKPGADLPFEAWTRRRDGKSRAPDAVAAGPEVEALVRLPGRPAPVRLADLLEDPGGRGVALRFNGNAANIPRWESGCVVCLYSCPGAKVGNARYTVRDFVAGATRFRARRGALPPDGTRVGVILRLSPQASAAP
jgi:hypothetical protein